MINPLSTKEEIVKAIIQMAVYLALAGVGFGGYWIWKNNIKKEAKQEITIEQQDDVIGQHNIADANQAEDGIAIQDEARSSSQREQNSIERALRAETQANRRLEAENEKLRQIIEEGGALGVCLGMSWPDELSIPGGNTIRPNNENGSSDSE